MSSRQTNIRTRSPQGGELSLQTTTTDAPVLPIAQLEQLSKIAPERVNWVFEETSKESEFRRNETKRANTLSFLTNMATLAAAVFVVCGVLGVAVYAMVVGETAVAIALATATLVSLAAVFINSNKHKESTVRRKS